VFAQRTYRCPNCRLAIGEPLDEVDSFTCSACGKSYAVSMDPDTRRIALFEDPSAAMPEPLHMPRGSIRALVTLLMAGSCWAMVLRGREVPDYLFSLLLAAIGYYFGFRAEGR
jgi:hypothetical protein